MATETRRVLAYGKHGNRWSLFCFVMDMHEGWMDGRIDDGWMDGWWMDDGWMEGWMDDGWMMDGRRVTSLRGETLMNTGSCCFAGDVPRMPPGAFPQLQDSRSRGPGLDPQPGLDPHPVSTGLWRPSDPRPLGPFEFLWSCLDPMYVDYFPLILPFFRLWLPVDVCDGEPSSVSARHAQSTDEQPSRFLSTKGDF